MKKLALSLAVLFAVGMVSCGGNKEKEECADSAAPVEVVEEGVAVEEQVAPADSAAATDSAATTPEAAPEAPAEEPAK